jgi:competence protein ComEC
MGIHSLSAIVLTHPQRDHVGGAADVIRRLRVGEVLEPGLVVTGPESEDALAAARERNVPVRVVRTGDRFRVGRLRVDVLWPEDAGTPGEDPNQNAVVLIASYGETDVYLSADAESDVTARLPLRDVDVMKVAHHGSEDPGLADELRTLQPEIAVISCGRHNEYGHPRPGTLAALAASPGLAVYRTDEDGRVVVESDGHELVVQTQR